MPPPQPFSASRFHGFICRSCISKLYTSQRQRPPWLARTITNDNRPSRPKRGNQQIPQQEPVVRYFDETPDGDRSEIYADEDPILKSLASEFADIEKQRRSLQGSHKDEAIIDGQEQFENVEQAIEGRIEETESTRAITSETEKLEYLLAKVKSLSDKDNISEEERLQIRQLLFGFISGSADNKDGTKVASLDVKESSVILPPSPAVAVVDEKKLSSQFPPKGSDVGSLDMKIRSRDFPTAYRQHINALKLQLHEASSTLRTGHANIRFRKVIWRTYLLCRSALTSQPQDVPLGIWSGLWAVLSQADSSQYIDRMAHIKYLGDDLGTVGVEMNLEQFLLYIEALLVQGDVDAAVESWGSVEPQPKNSEMLKSYLELGVKVFCRKGLLDRALLTAEKAVKDTDDAADFRILIPIIQCCLASHNPRAAKLAWAYYIRLRVNMGTVMNMDDYDSIILSFLEANELELALGGFKDMMLRPSMAKGLDSTSLYKSLTNVEGSLSSINIQEGELDYQNSRALTSLPPEFNNKFFFGSWMKKLIGEGELIAAKKVLDLMSERGIRPDARHMNGFIGAWFREGTESSIEMAEDMAWKMIHARLTFVKARNVKFELDGPLQPVQSEGKPDSKAVFHVPYATIETFCILIQQYRRRQKYEELDDLFETLRKAKIPPNRYFLNEIISLDVKNRHRSSAWSTYLSMTRSGAVTPDFETFTILWHQMCRAADPILRKRLSRPYDFPIARQLFAEMMRYKVSLSKHGKISQELYSSIVLAFSLSEDQPGTAVALKGLQKHFHTYPDDTTARTIVLQLSRLGQRNEGGYKSRRLKINNTDTRERVTNVTKIMEAFKQQRIKALQQEGIDFNTLTGTTRQEEAMNALTDLLRHAFQTKIKAEERTFLTIYEISKRTAEEMGVPECDPWISSAGNEVP